MPRKPTPPGKTRTRSHVIADLAVNHLERTELFLAGETVHVHIPTRNRIDRRAIRRIARYKHQISQQVSGRVYHHA